MFSSSTRPLAWVAIVALAALAVPTWKFGSPFLRQFFVSPFQLFIIPLWLLAYYSLRTGVMPARSGPPVRRDEDPAAYWQTVWFTTFMGAAMFAFNLWMSWQVVSRRR